MELSIVITSNIHNEYIALKRLLESLEKQNVTDEIKKNTKIIIFIGDENRKGYEYELKYNTIARKLPYTVRYIYAPHNSIDFTGLVGLLEFDILETDIFYYLHDTCEAGPDFIICIHKYANSEPVQNQKYTMSFPLPSMNIGFYNKTIIQRYSGVILSMKKPKTACVQEWKRLNVQREDLIFKRNIDFNTHRTFPLDRCQDGPIDYYNTGVLRIIEYYPCVDLKKIKANWFHKREYELRN